MTGVACLMAFIHPCPQFEFVGTPNHLASTVTESIVVDPHQDAKANIDEQGLQLVSQPSQAISKLVVFRLLEFSVRPSVFWCPLRLAGLLGFVGLCLVPASLLLGSVPFIAPVLPLCCITFGTGLVKFIPAYFESGVTCL